MSAYVQSINSIAAQRLAESLNKTAEKNDNSLSAVFQSALNLLEETNNLQHNAEAQELNLTLNYLENPHDVTDALTKAEMAIQYTVQIKNKALEAYKEIMNIQI